MSDEEEYGLTAATLYVNEDLEVISRLDADQQKRALALKEAAALIRPRAEFNVPALQDVDSLLRVARYIVTGQDPQSAESPTRHFGKAVPAFTTPTEEGKS